MAASENDEIPTVREGRGRRVFVASLIGLLMIELGLRLLLGNFGQVDVVQAVDDDRCLELVPGMQGSYSGWLQRIPPSEIRVNNQGARGAAIDARPRPGVLRVAVVGDAMTFGLGVEGGDAYAQVASRTLQREGIVNEVVNLAVPGHDFSQAAAQAITTAADLRPDVILVPVFADDLGREGCPPTPPDGPTAMVLKHVHSARVLWIAAQELRGRPAVDPSATKARFRGSIEALQRASRQHDFALALVLITDRDAFTDPAYCTDCPAAHDLVEGVDIDVVDLTGVWRQLRAERDTSFLRGEGRLSVEGHLRVGLHLGQALAGWTDLQRRATDRAARLR